MRLTDNIAIYRFLKFLISLKTIIGAIPSSGELRHEKYKNYENLVWQIVSNCTKVLVQSTKFETEEWFDYVTIDGVEFSGSTPVSILVESGQFFITFQSNRWINKDGFVLQWECYNGTCVVKLV